MLQTTIRDLTWTDRAIHIPGRASNVLLHLAALTLEEPHLNAETRTYCLRSARTHEVICKIDVSPDTQDRIRALESAIIRAKMKLTQS